MTTVEERLQVLRMIAGGEITAEEGARLLEALGEEGRRDEECSPASPEKGPRRFRIRVTDLETGKQKIDITLPWIMLSVGTRMGASFAPAGIDMEEVAEAIQGGAAGKIIEYEDKEAGERVEFFVDS